MAKTYTIKKTSKTLNMFANIVDIALSAEAYATGGIPIALGGLGVRVAQMVLPAPAAGYIFEFDHANSKLKAYNTTSYCFDGQQGVADANNTLIRQGATKGGVAGTGASCVIRGTAEEVQNATAITATVRCVVFGM